jgi:hypothetical protein
MKLQVARPDPNSFKDAEFLKVSWKEGKLKVTYIRLPEPGETGPYREIWEAICDKPVVTPTHYPSANLMSDLEELES